MSLMITSAARLAVLASAFPRTRLYMTTRDQFKQVEPSYCYHSIFLISFITGTSQVHLYLYATSLSISDLFFTYRLLV